MTLQMTQGLLRTAIYERLLSCLQQGAIAPGVTVSLNTLAENLKVSRTPLRDALLELQTEGFVTLYPQRGVMVNSLSEEEKREIYEVCSILDGQVIRNVFSLITPEHICRLRELNVKMDPSAPTFSNETYNTANLEFHNTYLQLEPNSIIRKIMQINRIRLFQFSTRNWGEAFCSADHDEHEMIIQLLESGTAEELSRYVTEVHWSFNWQHNVT